MTQIDEQSPKIDLTLGYSIKRLSKTARITVYSQHVKSMNKWAKEVVVESGYDQLQDLLLSLQETAKEYVGGTLVRVR